MTSAWEEIASVQETPGGPVLKICGVTANRQLGNSNNPKFHRWAKNINEAFKAGLEKEHPTDDQRSSVDTGTG